MAVTNPERPKNEWVRRVVFENKAGGGPDSVLLKMVEADTAPDKDPEWIRLEANSWSAPEKRAKKEKKAESVLAGLPYKDE